MRHRLVAFVSSRDKTVPRGRLVAPLVAPRATRRTVLFNAIEWSASGMHSIECSPSSFHRNHLHCAAFFILEIDGTASAMHLIDMDRQQSHVLHWSSATTGRAYSSPCEVKLNDLGFVYQSLVISYSLLKLRCVMIDVIKVLQLILS